MGCSMTRAMKSCESEPAARLGQLDWGSYLQLEWGSYLQLDWGS